MKHGDVDYASVALTEAYSLQNAGGLVLVCTKGQAAAEATARYDLAPVAWCCPLDYAPVSRILLVCDTAHRSFEDLAASKEFVLALPEAAQKDLVRHTGSISGKDVDKYGHFSIPAFRAGTVDALVPEGVAGWLECGLDTIYIEETSAIVTATVRAAFAREGAWKRRLHYVEDSTWFEPGKSV